VISFIPASKRQVIDDIKKKRVIVEKERKFMYEALRGMVKGMR
jgi:hypothetical protein